MFLGMGEPGFSPSQHLVCLPSPHKQLWVPMFIHKLQLFSIHSAAQLFKSHSGRMVRKSDPVCFASEFCGICTELSLETFFVNPFHWRARGTPLSLTEKGWSILEKLQSCLSWCFLMPILTRNACFCNISNPVLHCLEVCIVQISLPRSRCLSEPESSISHTCAWRSDCGWYPGLRRAVCNCNEMPLGVSSQ